MVYVMFQEVGRSTMQSTLPVDFCANVQLQILLLILLGMLHSFYLVSVGHRLEFFHVGVAIYYIQCRNHKQRIFNLLTYIRMSREVIQDGSFILRN